jgi:hypothetical protein
VRSISLTMIAGETDGVVSAIFCFLVSIEKLYVT